MAKGPVYDGDLLKLLLNATAIGNVADNTATAPLTGISVALHTADPSATTAGTQGTNEVAYTGYTRIVTTRSTAGFTGSRRPRQISHRPNSTIGIDRYMPMVRPSGRAARISAAISQPCAAPGPSQFK